MNEKKTNGPLKCWDIYAMHLLNQAAKFTGKLELDTLKATRKSMDGFSILKVYYLIQLTKLLY